MKSLLDYRMLILDKNAKIVKYPKNMLMMHQDCLDNFAKNNGYNSSNRDYLVDEGNCLFYNADNGIYVSFLPEKLTNEQLYMLDYIENFFDNVEYLEVSKGVGKNKLEYSFDDRVRENFSNIVIQSYYKDNVKKRK